LTTAPGGFRFLITATDYFTKWVEAKALVTIEETDVKSFIWKNVVSRFGAPYAFIVDNGTQFVGGLFTSFCEEHGILLLNSTPHYPPSNGQAEASNKTITYGIKRRLKAKKGLWAEELYHVLWSYRTTPRRATGQTPYAMAFGMEAVIPTELGLPTLRTKDFSTLQNNEAVAKSLDLVEGQRDLARIKIAKYQQELERGYNRSVRPRSFKVDDWVLRKTCGGKKKKLQPNWEGPYKVTKVAGTNSYRLEDKDGKAVPRAWNANNLRKYYA
jgi:hypothetical protein